MCAIIFWKKEVIKMGKIKIKVTLKSDIEESINEYFAIKDKNKIIQHLLQKGYEYSQIKEVINIYICEE